MDQTSAAESLVAAGFTRAEARVFCGLHEIGTGTAVSVAAKTGMERRSVYDALDKLTRRGLVHTVPGARGRLFAPSDSRAFDSYLADVHREAKTNLDAFIKHQSQNPPVPPIRIFSGREGIKAILNDVLETKKPFYNYGGAAYLPKFLPSFHQAWSARMARAHIPLSVIMTDSPEVRKRLTATNAPGVVHARFIPDRYVSRSVWWLYGDKVILVFWKDEPFAVVIEDKDLAKTYAYFFQQVWKTARP